MNAQEREELLAVLKSRFAENSHRHSDIDWDDVEKRIAGKPSALRVLRAMEDTGGEPDVIGRDEEGRITFCDCSKQSPSGRRSVCYDKQAREARKKNRPESSALEMAKEIGIEILNEEEYRQLQELEPFDTKTSSWVATPSVVRKLGGALFCDRRYDKVFLYHNGADSYYAARGFRGRLSV